MLQYSSEMLAPVLVQAENDKAYEYDLMFYVCGKGMVVADLQRSAFGRLVIVVYLLSFLC